jgi:SAM-dependent methyltransferase
VQYLRSILSIPTAYRLFGQLIGSRNYQVVYQCEYVQASPGQRILDIGCGPGDVLTYLPAVEYVGLDINPKYIRAAQARFRGRGEFRCEDVAKAVVREPASYDIVMANGVLHHLADSEARHLLELARQALKPTGRLVTHDPVYVANQSLTIRTLLRLDRGQFVRTPQAYQALVGQNFYEVHSHIRHDLLRIPYSVHIMVCTGPAKPALRFRPVA